jgi:alanine racemase
VLQRRAGAADLMAVIKANAYGHGAPEVARALHEAGVRHFAVARVSEALQLRESGLADAILVLGAPLVDDLPLYAEHDLGVTISSAEIARAVTDLAHSGQPMRVHVKVDTGMGRIGVTPEEAPSIAQHLAATPGINLAGLWTHFASAHDPDDPYTRNQFETFRAVVESVQDQAGVERLHIANSSALFMFEESVEAFEPALVRVGLTLYGLGSRPEMIRQAGLRPVMRLLSQVTHIKTVKPGTSISYGRRWTAERTTRIATIGAGYGDGFPRLLSNRGEVGIGGRRYPVVGTICMDMFMIDLGPPGTPASDAVSLGDTVTLMGPGGPSSAELATWADTIPYEICCGISARVPRRYVSGSNTAP